MTFLAYEMIFSALTKFAETREREAQLKDVQVQVEDEIVVSEVDTATD